MERSGTSKLTCTPLMTMIYLIQLNALTLIGLLLVTIVVYA